MPILKSELAVPANGTTSSLLANTTYEDLAAGTRLVVAAGTPNGEDVTINVDINNVVITPNAKLSKIVDGEAFGWRGNYVINDLQIATRSRVIITFTNNTGTAVNAAYAVYIGS